MFLVGIVFYFILVPSKMSSKLEAAVHLLRYLRKTMSVFSESPPLSFLLDFEQISKWPTADYRMDMENTYRRLEEGSEKSLLITEHSLVQTSSSSLPA